MKRFVPGQGLSGNGSGDAPSAECGSDAPSQQGAGDACGARVGVASLAVSTLRWRRRNHPVATGCRSHLPCVPGSPGSKRDGGRPIFVSLECVLPKSRTAGGPRRQPPPCPGRRWKLEGFPALPECCEPGRLAVRRRKRFRQHALETRPFSGCAGARHQATTFVIVADWTADQLFCAACQLA
jgi:hypothetical protein